MQDKTELRTTLAAAGALALAALPVLASASVLAPRTDAPLARRLAAPARAGRVAIIAKTAGPVTAAQEAQIAALGGRITARLPLIGAVALSVPARNLARLAALPFVAHLSSDGTVAKCDAFTVGSSGAGVAWQAPYRLTGRGVTVAVVDSGVKSDLHDFGRLPTDRTKGPRVLADVSFSTDSHGKTLDPGDECGHGTHVAGIIAGDGDASTGKDDTKTFLGVAPAVSLVNVRVLDKNGGGTVSSVLSGIQWVVANKSRYNIRVLNLSLGHPVGESYTTDPLCQAVEAAWRAGLTVVCAAGNEGRLDAAPDQPDNEGWGTAYGSIQSPGNDPFVLTVGATKSMDGVRADDKIATYSSRGPSRLDLVCKPDLVAPGNRVVSLDAGDGTLDRNVANQIPIATYRRGGNGQNASHDYFVLSGTSMAAPVAAGAAALLLQADPTLSPDTIKARLMLSADKPDAWTDSAGRYDPCTYGAGYLNIPAALNCGFTVSGEYAISPSLSLAADGSVGVNDDHALWGKTTVDSSHALWGKSALWGSGGVTDLQALWGSHALWGKNTLASSQAVHNSSVWTDHAHWGSAFDGVDLSSVVVNGE